MFPSLLYEPLALSSKLWLSNLDTEPEKARHIWLSDAPILLILDGNMQPITSRGNLPIFWPLNIRKSQPSCCCEHNGVVPNIFTKPGISRMCLNVIRDQVNCATHLSLDWSDLKALGPMWGGRMHLLEPVCVSTGPRCGTHCALRSLVCAGIPTHCSSFPEHFTARQAVCGISLYLNKTSSNKNHIFVRLPNVGIWKIGWFMEILFRSVLQC